MDSGKCGELDPESGARCHSSAASEHAKHLGRIEGSLVSWQNDSYRPPKRKIGSRRMQEIARTLRDS